MDKTTITVSAEVAEKYNNISVDDQNLLQMLISILLDSIAVQNRAKLAELVASTLWSSASSTPPSSEDRARLLAAMDEISTKAAERGLTPEILEELLADDT